ncbi:MAG TPA: hypothetical protein VJN01_02945 [Xanthomonadales bacterium]|nr:hypothetical protein [Xanthomonadales bacterium]
MSVPTENPNGFEAYYFHRQRNPSTSVPGDVCRCFDAHQQIVFNAHTIRFGKPITVYDPAGRTLIAEIRNRDNYLLNGRTDFCAANGGGLLGSYSRFSRVYDAQDNKIGYWRDAQSWAEELKVNLIDAIANALLGSGDGGMGANPSDTHLLTDGQDILAILHRKKLPFFPDPPKRSSPGRLAKLASRIVPGELGKSLAEITPPYGWCFTLRHSPPTRHDEMLLHYSALVRMEYMRWSRS